MRVFTFVCFALVLLASVASAGGGISVLCGDAPCPSKNGVISVPMGTPVVFTFEGDTANISDVYWSFGDGRGQQTNKLQPVRHAYNAAPQEGYTVKVSFWRQVSENTRQKEEYYVDVLVAPAGALLSSAGACVIAGVITLNLDQTLCSGINNLIGMIIGYLSSPGSARR